MGPAASRRAAFCFVVLAVLFTSSAREGRAATIVFSDGFEADAVGLNQFTFVNWSVPRGSVDVVTCGGSGNCVDLDGSTGTQAGSRLETKSSFNFLAGEQYELVFSMPTGTQNQAFNVSVGSLLTQSFSGYALPLNQTLAFTVAADATGAIAFDLPDGLDNFGPYLTQVDLIRTVDATTGGSDDTGGGDAGGDGGSPEVPEPASLVLLGTGVSLIVRRLRR